MAEDDGLERLGRALASRYEVIREIGRGGSATVYLARDLRNDRDVAVKLLDAAVAGPTGTHRFLREIRVISTLDHPNILPLLDSGEADGLPFYVAPFVPGRSLRDRLDSEGQLPLEEVVELAADIAGALDYAHGRGVIHRDVKPDNILLEEDRALVADFGIVRAFEHVEGGRLTTTGVALGSPMYMSPEQTTGTDAVGTRSDVYGLACLLYEALVGEPPFSGPTAQVVFAKKLSVTPSPPSKLRTGLPPALDAVLARGLAPVPADRYETPGELASALRTAARSRDTSRHRRAAWAGVAIACLGLVAWWIAAEARQEATPIPDPDRVMILPFETDDASVDLDEVSGLRDAIARWSGVSVVDPLVTREQMGDRPIRSLARAAEVARELGAGRFIRGTISRRGDSLRVHGIVYSSSESSTALHDHVVRMTADEAASGSALDVLADELLFGGRLDRPGEEPSGTRSAPARRAFIEGEEALSDWALPRADSAFSRAASQDPDFAAAHLWSGLVRFWNDRPVNELSTPAARARLGAEELPPGGRTAAEALAAFVDGDLGAACRLWDRLARDHPRDHTAWFSLARCLDLDPTVVETASSPSGWSFRTSTHGALRAYRRAFELHPPILSSFSGEAYEPLLTLLKASGNQRRVGISEGPSPRRFAADPAWRGDSLAFVPWPIESARSRVTVEADEFQLALLRRRQAVRDITARWASADPESADARAALALSLTMLGDPSGLDTLQVARELSSSDRERSAAMALEVWLRLALSLPSDVDGIRRSRALADSLLSAPDSGLSRASTARLAALTGRAHRAAELVSQPGGASVEVFAPPIRRWGPPLMVYSAFGGPEDSIASFEARGWSSVRRELAPDQRSRAIFEWLARPATLAFPTFAFAGLDSLTDRGDWLLDAQAALRRGDSATTWQQLTQVEMERREIPPANLTLDGLFPEASLLYELGRFEAAARWLDPTLDALPQASPHVLSTPERGAALVRAMALRARVADAVGDAATAARWAMAVATLWSDADAFLQPSVTEMRALTGVRRE